MAQPKPNCPYAYTGPHRYPCPYCDTLALLDPNNSAQYVSRRPTDGPERRRDAKPHGL